MPVLAKFALYIAFVVVAGSLLAPPLWFAGQWAIESDWLPLLAGFRFPKYLNRGVLIAALVGLWPFLKSLGLKNFGSMGLQPNPAWKSDAAMGFLAGAGGLSLVAAGLVWADRLALKATWSWGWLGSAMATAITVALLEEFFFRGALFGVMRRYLKPVAAGCWLSLIFAALHFIKPHKSLKRWSGDVEWWTGFDVLAHSFWQFAEPRLLVGGLLTLFAVGAVLTVATYATKSLFYSIGLHAGWVFVLRLVQMSSRQQGPADWWVGRGLITGVVPLVLVVATGAWLYVFAWRKRALRIVD